MSGLNLSLPYYCWYAGLGARAGFFGSFVIFEEFGDNARRSRKGVKQRARRPVPIDCWRWRQSRHLAIYFSCLLQMIELVFRLELLAV